MELSITQLQPDSILISKKDQSGLFPSSAFIIQPLMDRILRKEKALHHTSDCINRKYFKRETIKYSRCVL